LRNRLSDLARLERTSKRIVFAGFDRTLSVDSLTKTDPLRSGTN